MKAFLMYLGMFAAGGALAAVSNNLSAGKSWNDSNAALSGLVGGAATAIALKIKPPTSDKPTSPTQ